MWSVLSSWLWTYLWTLFCLCKLKRGTKGPGWVRSAACKSAIPFQSSEWTLKFNSQVIKNQISWLGPEHILPVPDRVSFHGQIVDQCGQIPSQTRRLRLSAYVVLPRPGGVDLNVHRCFQSSKCVCSKNRVRETPHGHVIRHSVLFCTQTHLLPWVCNTAFCGWITPHCHSRLVYITRPPCRWIQGPETEHGAERGDTTGGGAVCARLWGRSPADAQTPDRAQGVHGS